MDTTAGIRRTNPSFALLPGIAFAAAIGAVAMMLNRLPGVGVLSPLILAILIGVALRNTLGLPQATRPGISFSARRLLRTAIILLGFQLSLAQVLQVGMRGLVLLVIIVLATLAFSRWFGRRIGVSGQLTDLIAAGTSICGASAVLAMNAVTEARDEDVAYAVASVTIFGTIAMFAYPALWHFAHLSDVHFGFWAGSSIHEVAQVVAAAFQVDTAAGQLGTIVKLTRVMMLAPIVLALSVLTLSRVQSSGTARRLPIPWFVFGFAGAVAVNSTVTISADIRFYLVLIITFLLAASLGALGLEIEVAKLKAKGLRPLLLGLTSSLFIAGLSFSLIKLML